MPLRKSFLLAQKSTQVQILSASRFPDIIVELVVGVDNAPVNFMLQYDSLKALVYVFRRGAVILRIHKKEMLLYEVHAFDILGLGHLIAVIGQGTFTDVHVNQVIIKVCRRILLRGKKCPLIPIFYRLNQA